MPMPALVTASLFPSFAAHPSEHEARTFPRLCAHSSRADGLEFKLGLVVTRFTKSCLFSCPAWPRARPVLLALPYRNLLVSSFFGQSTCSLFIRASIASDGCLILIRRC